MPNGSTLGPLAMSVLNGLTMLPVDGICVFPRRMVPLTLVENLVCVDAPNWNGKPIAISPDRPEMISFPMRIVESCPLRSIHKVESSPVAKFQVSIIFCPLTIHPVNTIKPSNNTLFILFCFDCYAMGPIYSPLGSSKQTNHCFNYRVETYFFFPLKWRVEEWPCETS